MRPAALLAAILALFLFLPGTGAAPAGAADFQKNIMTGGPKGTYIRIGRDIAAVAAACGQTLTVQESAGSLENLAAVKNRVYTQFGIVQSDVLDYVNSYSATDADLRRAILGVRIMYPLYNEEVHVLARREIPNLAALSGKKVAIGKTDSGNYLTATLILDILRVQNTERLPLNPDEALPKLVAGEIDALFYVAGAPTALFNDPSIDGAKFHLLPITEQPLLATYTPSRVEGGTYPFQPDPVDLVAVKAVLMTFDYQPGRNEYHRQSCKAASDMASLILTNLDKLRAEGHPKWKQIDLAALPPGWKVSDCVKAGMAETYKLACTAPVAPPAAPDAAANVSADQEYLNLLKQRLKD